MEPDGVGVPDGGFKGSLLGSALLKAEIRVYDDAGNVIETHEHKGDFKEW